MRQSLGSWIGWSLAAALGVATPAWGQHAPLFSGSSSAKSSAAVSSLSLSAPTGLSTGDLMVAEISQAYTPGWTSVNLTSVANVDPYAASGAPPASGGLDGAGNAFRTDLVGTSLTYNGATFTLCGANTACGVASGVAIPLPAGKYSTVNFLATSEWYGPAGYQGAVFTVTYTDGTTTTYTQNISDMQSPQSYSGETTVSQTHYRVQGDGSNAYSAGWYIYGYTFALNSSKTVSSFTVPGTRDVQVLGLSLYTTSNTGGVAPSGWTSLTETSNGAISQAVYYRTASSADVAGSTTYTFSFPSSGLAAGSIMTFNGVSATPIATSAAQANAASTSFTAPAVSYVSSDTWVGLYSVANGSSTSPDFGAPDSAAATNVIDTGTGSGSSGVLIGGFYENLESKGCSSACQSSTWVATSKAGTSAGSIGTSIIIAGGTPSASALWHFDETSWSGTTGEVTDSSGNGYNGVAQHSATTAGISPALTGSPGTCYYGTLNGTNQYVKLPTTLPHVGSSTTITAWIRPTAGSTGGRIFSDDYNSDGFAFSYGDAGSGNSQVISFYARNVGLTLDTSSSSPLTLNTWYFVAADLSVSGGYTYLFLMIFDTSGNLVTIAGNSAPGTWSPGTGPYATIGGNADSSTVGAGHDFPGNIDEVTIYDGQMTYNQVQALASTRHACTASVPDHYAVTTPGTAVNCDPATITVTAHSAAHTAVDTPDTITLGTSTGHGDWTLSSGAGTFTAGASNSGSATYTYVQADAGVAVFKLRDTYPETVTINVTDGSGTATAKSGSATAAEDAPLTFAPSGFRITNGSNVAATIGTQQAGVTSTQSLALQAVRTDLQTNACTSLFTTGTIANVGIAFQCNNPTSCVSGQTLTFTNNGTSTSVAANSSAGFSSYTSVPVKFTTANGEAPFTIDYTDAGQITLGEKYSIPLGNGSSSANAILGASQFVVQPYTLKLSNIKNTASGTANPGASTASGTVFMPAGQAFTATVTATNYQGNATPNFGQEISPAAVTLSPALVLPSSGGHTPSVSGSFGTYSSGSATGTAFSWPEVGIMTLTPGVTNYLGSGSLTGTPSGNVGRFIPNGFATSLNTPVFGTGCSAGAFTYLGQPFTYTVAPVITVTAQAYGGATTQNYTGSLWRLTNASLAGRNYTPTPATPSLVTTGLPSTATDPAIVDAGSSGGTAGNGTLTFSAGSGLSFLRGTPIVPISANVALSINVIDLDGAAASNPVTFGSGSGISFSTGASQYYGRLALRNATGSELLDLPMSLTTQYYASAATGFTTNTADSCSAAPSIAFSGYQMNLTSGKTCVRDSGNPGVSGAGCSAAAGSAYRSTALAGDFNLILAAPGSGYNGALNVTATPTASWLQYLWSASSGTNSSPSGEATFGVFPGSASRIYQREVY